MSYYHFIPYPPVVVYLHTPTCSVVMAEAEDQQNFVAHNGDQVPDQGLDELHNGIPYRVHDDTVGHQPYQVLGPQQYEVQDQTLEPQQYEVQDQLVYHQYQLQDHAHEEVQDQPQDDLQYQPQDQEQYHLQDEAHDQARYQAEGEAQDHNGDEVQDKVEDEEEIPEHLESLQKSEPEEGATVGGEEKRWPGWPGETVFRMLVPIQKVGSIIGRKGDAIKKIIEETRAQIKILDGPPGTTERAALAFVKKFKRPWTCLTGCNNMWTLRLWFRQQLSKEKL